MCITPQTHECLNDHYTYVTANALTATESRNYEAQSEIPNALSNGRGCEHGPKKLVVVSAVSLVSRCLH